MSDDVMFMLTANSCHENISGSESSHFAPIKVVMGVIVDQCLRLLLRS